MWLSSYSYHSAIGVDSDQLVKQQVHSYYYRLNWSGNGSLYIGKGITKRAYRSNERLDDFDLAAIFFQSIYKKQPMAESISNKIGCWYINLPGQQFWIGFPAWLPVVFFGFLWFLQQLFTNRLS